MGKKKRYSVMKISETGKVVYRFRNRLEAVDFIKLAIRNDKRSCYRYRGIEYTSQNLSKLETAA